MANFVLVHGAWHGGWCWQRVVERLHAQGHRAHAVTLKPSGYDYIGLFDDNVRTLADALKRAGP